MSALMSKRGSCSHRHNDTGAQGCTLFFALKCHERKTPCSPYHRHANERRVTSCRAPQRAPPCATHPDHRSDERFRRGARRALRPSRLARSGDRAQPREGRSLSEEGPSSGRGGARDRAGGEAWGGLDILINNAGVTGGSSIEDDSIDLWHRIIEINTFGVVYGCKAFVPVLRESGGGHIVNIASVAAFVSAPEMASYNVSKAAVLSLSETLDAELAPHHIDVTVACPGVFQSELGAEGRVLAPPNARMMKSLRREQETTNQTAEDVVGKIVIDAARRRLYSLPGGDLRAQWIIKRISPEFSRRFIAFLYTRRLWKFAEMGD
jgi:NAD(P)-dependent dehydrogenase (short-subunit alcohol dehydrogenase family)